MQFSLLIHWHIDIPYAFRSLRLHVRERLQS